MNDFSYLRKCETLIAFWNSEPSKISIEYIDELIEEGFLEQVGAEVKITMSGVVAAQNISRILDFSDYLLIVANKILTENDKGNN